MSFSDWATCENTRSQGDLRLVEGLELETLTDFLVDKASLAQRTGGKLVIKSLCNSYSLVFKDLWQ